MVLTCPPVYSQKWRTCSTAATSSSHWLNVSARDVNVIGQYWGQTAIDWVVIRRKRPGGSIRPDTVNTQLRRVDRSLTNGHQLTGTRAIDPRASCNPLLPDWSVSKGLWCVVVSIPWWDTEAVEGNCIGDKFTIRVRVIFSYRSGA